MDEAAILAECAALDAAYARADDEARRNSNPSITVDLKWSLWTTDQTMWRAAAGEKWPLVCAALTGEMDEDCSLTIRTSPRKEIRDGHVYVRWNSEGDLIAEVFFRAEWDEPRDLAHTLLSQRLHQLAQRRHPCRRRQALRRLGGDRVRTEPTQDEIDRFCDGFDAGGSSIERTVPLSDDLDLDGALRAIDAVESLLITEDAASWDAISEKIRTGEYDYLLDADVRPRARRTKTKTIKKEKRR